MSAPQLEAARAETNRLAALISARADGLPTFGSTEDFARPHVEASPSGYYYVIVERGVELQRTHVGDLRELMFLVFRDVCFEEAGRFELQNRVPGQDHRRIRFARQLELLEKLNPVWREREAARLDQVLEHHPYRD